MPDHRRSEIVPDLLLERYRLGELPEPERASVAALVAADPAVDARLRELDRSDEEIRAQHPTADIARDVRTRARRQRPSRPMRTLGFLAAGGAAAAIVLAIMMRPAPAPDDRIKGLEPSIAVYRQTSHGSERLADDALAHAGDVLRLGYVAAGAPYGVIVSIDGRGIVTLHLPKTETSAAPLATGSPTLLDQAYELDDAPAIERFYFVTGATPFAVNVVKEAVTKATAGHPGSAPAHLTLPKDLSQFTIAVRKD